MSRRRYPHGEVGRLLRRATKVTRDAVDLAARVDFAEDDKELLRPDIDAVTAAVDELQAAAIDTRSDDE